MLNSVYLVICVATAFAAFWTMQCVTVHAGFRCYREMAVASMRVFLAAVAAASVFDAYAVAKGAAYASIWGTVLAGAFLLFLISVPIAVGGRRGADRLMFH